MYTKPKTAAGATTSSGGGVVYANTQASGRAATLIRQDMPLSLMKLSMPIRQVLRRT